MAQSRSAKKLSSVSQRSLASRTWPRWKKRMDSRMSATTFSGERVRTRRRVAYQGAVVAVMGAAPGGVHLGPEGAVPHHFGIIVD